MSAALPRKLPPERHRPAHSTFHVKRFLPKKHAVAGASRHFGYGELSTRDIRREMPYSTWHGPCRLRLRSILVDSGNIRLQTTTIPLQVVLCGPGCGPVRRAMAW